MVVRDWESRHKAALYDDKVLGSSHANVRVVVELKQIKSRDVIKRDEKDGRDPMVLLFGS